MMSSVTLEANNQLRLQVLNVGNIAKMLSQKTLSDQGTFGAHYQGKVDSPGCSIER